MFRWTSNEGPAHRVKGTTTNTTNIPPTTTPRSKRKRASEPPPNPPPSTNRRPLPLPSKPTPSTRSPPPVSKGVKPPTSTSSEGVGGGQGSWFPWMSNLYTTTVGLFGKPAEGDGGGGGTKKKRRRRREGDDGGQDDRIVGMNGLGSPSEMTGTVMGRGGSGSSVESSPLIALSHKSVVIPPAPPQTSPAPQPPPKTPHNPSPPTPHHPPKPRTKPELSSDSLKARLLQSRMSGKTSKAMVETRLDSTAASSTSGLLGGRTADPRGRVAVAGVGTRWSVVGGVKKNDESGVSMTAVPKKQRREKRGSDDRVSLTEGSAILTAVPPKPDLIAGTPNSLPRKPETGRKRKRKQKLGAEEGDGEGSGGRGSVTREGDWSSSRFIVTREGDGSSGRSNATREVGSSGMSSTVPFARPLSMNPVFTDPIPPLLSSMIPPPPAKPIIPSNSPLTALLLPTPSRATQPPKPTPPQSKRRKRSRKSNTDTGGGSLISFAALAADAARARTEGVHTLPEKPTATMATTVKVVGGAGKRVEGNIKGRGNEITIPSCFAVPVVMDDGRDGMVGGGGETGVKESLSRGMIESKLLLKARRRRVDAASSSTSTLDAPVGIVSTNGAKSTSAESDGPSLSAPQTTLKSKGPGDSKTSSSAGSFRKKPTTSKGEERDVAISTASTNSSASLPKTASKSEESNLGKPPTSSLEAAPDSSTVSSPATVTSSQDRSMTPPTPTATTPTTSCLNRSTPPSSSKPLDANRQTKRPAVKFAPGFTAPTLSSRVPPERVTSSRAQSGTALSSPTPPKITTSPSSSLPKTIPTPPRPTRPSALIPNPTAATTPSNPSHLTTDPKKKKKSLAGDTTQALPTPDHGSMTSLVGEKPGGCVSSRVSFAQLAAVAVERRGGGVWEDCEGRVGLRGVEEASGGRHASKASEKGMKELNDGGVARKASLSAVKELSGGGIDCKASLREVKELSGDGVAYTASLTELKELSGGGVAYTASLKGMKELNDGGVGSKASLSEMNDLNDVKELNDGGVARQASLNVKNPLKGKPLTPTNKSFPTPPQPTPSNPPPIKANAAATPLPIIRVTNRASGSSNGGEGWFDDDGKVLKGRLSEVGKGREGGDADAPPLGRMGAGPSSFSLSRDEGSGRGVVVKGGKRRLIVEGGKRVSVKRRWVVEGGKRESVFSGGGDGEEEGGVDEGLWSWEELRAAGGRYAYARE
ncbi:hypothetical protein HDU67_006919 [Dinochytrium kinnereticum]|nr:hypothetical protein HDU67_006919 [Dinochytrium kinnereticum]